MTEVALTSHCPTFALNAEGVKSSRKVESIYDRVDQVCVLNDQQLVGHALLTVGVNDDSLFYPRSISLDVAACRHLAGLLAKKADELENASSIDRLFSLLGGPAEIGRLIGKTTEHAAAMKRRGSIPVRYWKQLIGRPIANSRILTLEDLHEAHRERVDPPSTQPDPADLTPPKEACGS